MPRTLTLNRDLASADPILGSVTDASTQSSETGNAAPFPGLVLVTGTRVATMPSVDLVIPSYGGDIWSTLTALDSAGLPDHVYIINNAARSIKPREGQTIIYPGRNIGWEAGNNVGLAMSRAKYVILMNDDVEPQTKDWHLKLVQPMEEDENIGLVGPRVRGHQNYQGRIPEGAYLDPLIDLSPIVSPTEGQMPYFRMSFFCVAMRRELFHDVGPMDDRFSVPATGKRGGDDEDYTWRAYLEGWGMVCATQVWVNHVDQGQTYRALGATASNIDLLKEKWSWT